MAPVNVFFVTYPRSGHHFLAQSLDKLCTIADDYCETYNCFDCYRRPVSCPGKVRREKDPIKHIERQPCQSGRRFIKHHDFYRQLEWHGENKYIIQYRHPLESIVSWFDFELAYGAEDDDTDAAFRKFLSENLEQWRFFATRWVLRVGRRKPNATTVQYERLMSGREAAAEELARIIQFAGLEMPAPERLRAVTETAAKTRILSDYRYYDRDLFAECEALVLPLMKKTSIAPQFHQ